MDAHQTPDPVPQPFVTAQLAGPPPPAPRKRRIGLLSVFVIGFLLLALGVSALLNMVLLAGSAVSDFDPRVRERHFSHNRSAANKVVIMSVEGVILDAEGFFRRQIEQVRKDKSVRAIVLRVDSPGGSVSGSDAMHHRLAKLAEEREVPIVVSMGGLAASGGYYVSMAVGPRPETIYAEPTTWTGSIGVIIPHYDATELMKKVGVEQDSIASHRLKGMGSFTRPMTEEERKILQGLVDDAFARFKDVVKQGRPKFKADPAALDKLATGQAFTADQALRSGLVDKIGYLEDAVDQAVKLTGLSSDEVRVVEYKREFSLADIFLSSQARSQGFDPAALLEMTVPRAYYLCTWLPPVFSGRDH